MGLLPGSFIPKRPLYLALWRFWTLLHKATRHNNPLSDEEDIEGSGDVAPKLRPELEQAVSNIYRFLSAELGAELLSCQP